MWKYLLSPPRHAKSFFFLLYPNQNITKKIFFLDHPLSFNKIPIDEWPHRFRIVVQILKKNLQIFLGEKKVFARPLPPLSHKKAFCLTPLPASSGKITFYLTSPPPRHGICHGYMDIICVKYLVLGKSFAQNIRRFVENWVFHICMVFWWLIYFPRGLPWVYLWQKYKFYRNLS